MALSQSSVLKLYLSVIEDVISGVRECFLDEGVDEQVLQELKQTWEGKIHSNKALVQNDGTDGHGAARGGARMANSNRRTNETNEAAAMVQATQATEVVSQEKLYPVQITLPPQQNTGETAHRVLTIQVPESAIAGNQLQSVLTGPLIGATLALPTALATSLLQQHVTAALRGQQAGTLLTARPFVQNNPAQLDGACDDVEPECSWRVLPAEPQPGSSGTHRLPSGSTSSSRQVKGGVSTSLQVDGGMDSSDDDDEDDDDDDDDIDGDDAEVELEEGEEEGAEEEPLNSEDDVSEEDVSDMLDTENVVVCQYDKITRSRNKWKFYLKDGIMNLQGKDYVFQKSNGDAEW